MAADFKPCLLFSAPPILLLCDGLSHGRKAGPGAAQPPGQRPGALAMRRRREAQLWASAGHPSGSQPP